MNRHIKAVVCFGLPLLVAFLPLTLFPIESFTLVQQRVLAIFLMAALCWVLEPIPIFATSVLIIVLQLLTISNGGFFLFTQSDSGNLGELLSYQSIMSSFASPIIMLFLGGFFLAMAATKYRLDINLARVMLKPFGEKPSRVMLGLMVITAVFSMFMSNTATTAMMLSILAPVLAVFSKNDMGRVAMALCIPIAANIGGIGTPIGTPPNAIALKYLVGDDAISFGSWMAFGVPFVIILLAFAWLLLCKLYPSSEQSIKLEIKGKFLKTTQAYIVYVTFAATILLWLMGKTHGMNSYVVAMIPVAVFTITKIITKDDLKKISWDVLWLVSGGIAMGAAMGETGLAENIIASIPFENFSPLSIIFGASVLCLLMANFMSHTATANLLLPIVATLGMSMDSLIPYGGAQGIILVVTFAASLGMSLPISTPPNALAHATGFTSTNQMARTGVIIGSVGLLLSYVLVFLLIQVGFIATI
ncbi:SLC13/DASS family transporter [Alginatibacterium sediminis]|uniref:SLC13/DASS family transporter n=1 Tax=Alginatibacterium sediminis TaxID=2164068 RepID=A0A420E7P0_9ALTE|nr:SLC13 family permease [Alginatibacterium sediminis]RKF14439.1 SLC13/DASS family transporter [Alginatibacterium sediminis]